MSSEQKTHNGNSSYPKVIPPLTETRLSETTLSRVSGLTEKTEANLMNKRKDLKNAILHNVRGQNDAKILNLKLKIRNLEKGLANGAVARHQREDVADAQKNYAFAKAVEHDNLTMSLGKQPTYNR